MLYDIALTLQPYVGPRTTAHLLRCMGSAEAVFKATVGELIDKAQLNAKIAASFVGTNALRQAEQEIQYCIKHGVEPVVSTSMRYPQLLLECDDYPHVLYFKGSPEVLGARMLSVVGTRKITSYGQKVCDRIIDDLAAAFPELVIVSGLAHGVDGAAHRAALAHGLRTLAVLPCALPGIYPSNHATLADEIVKRGGGLITEYHSNSPNNGNNFIPRNRIIAGLSEGTLLIESPDRGGALATINMADGYGRSVMAVPGRVGDMCSEGTNAAIRSNKARMVCSARDIIEELMWDIEPQRKKEPAYDMSVLSPEARKLLEVIPDGESLSIDELAEKVGLPVQNLATLIFELECDGIVRLMPGKRYEKNR